MSSINITREEAIRKHRELWHWMANKTRECGHRVSERDNPDGTMNWLCKYVANTYGDAFSDCGLDCPICWDENDPTSTCLGCISDYVCADDPEEAARIADKIAELPERK